MDCSSEDTGYGTKEEARRESYSRTKSVTCWARDQSNEKCSCKSNDVGVGDFDLTQFEIVFDSIG